MFCHCMNNVRIWGYPNELKIKDTTDTQKFPSYPDLHLEIDNGGRLKCEELMDDGCQVMAKAHIAFGKVS